MTTRSNGASRRDTVNAVVALLKAQGFDPGQESIAETPARVAAAYDELLAGYDVDVDGLLNVQFDADHDEMVMLSGISFYSMCEHHLLPFYGTAAVGYLPQNDRVVGLSKLARLVEAHARRLQLQERMTHDIARDLQDSKINPAGVAVVVRAQHLCMCARGVSKPGAVMTTSVMLGEFRDTPQLRHEFLTLMKG
jgi:GTP cyclohydrolase I